MNAGLLSSLAAARARTPERQALLDAVLREGLPGPRSEAWRQTPLRALERRSFAPAHGAPDALSVPGLLAAIPEPRIVFVNGRFDPAHSVLPPWARPLQAVLADADPRAANFLERRYAGRDAMFASVNAALATDGLVVRLDPGSDGGVLHCVGIGQTAAADLAWHLRHFIELREGARLTLIEHVLAADAHAHLGNVVSQLHLKPGALLRHVRVQDDAATATQLLRTDAVLAREARYERLDLELGAGLSRHDLDVRLEGESASVRANGVLLGDGRRHLHTRLGIDHIARGTRCDLGWRGLAAQRARCVFHGGIAIRAGADGSEARLSNHHLLLSDDAQIDSQPVLEIHADEVTAAHGATVGQLDPAHLFYLRSRGLPDNEARRLLTMAFCRQVLDIVDDRSLQDALSATLDAALLRSALS